MALLLGLDEAGYGPNLGPLVIAATVWEVPDDPVLFDVWRAFDGIVSDRPDPTLATVHVADSKVVHSSAAGIAAVERSATAILQLADRCRGSLFDLWDHLVGRPDRPECGEPWFCDADLSLPIAVHSAQAFDIVQRWTRRCGEIGCRLVNVGCEILPARFFNASVRECGSKGRVLTEATLRLIRRFWNPDHEPALIICDKHGGRDRYAEFLAEQFPSHLPLCLEESRSRSRYRLGKGEIRFGVRSEEHLPVAAASIVAKYLREATMEAFNRYWLARRPDLRPTRGYPVDAARFLEQIAGDADGLGLKRDDYWRSR